MEYVKLNGMYRGILLTADLTTTPNEAAWPDADIVSGDLTVTVGGVTHPGSKSITKSAVSGETGKHTIVIDCNGVAEGLTIELSGAYYIDSVRYYFAAEIYVSSSTALTGEAEDSLAETILAAFLADSDFGVAGLIADAATSATQSTTAATQTAPAALRTAMGLESANLANLVNAVIGKKVVTPVGDGRFDIAVRNAADSATLVTIRHNPVTGDTVVL